MSLFGKLGRWMAKADDSRLASMALALAGGGSLSARPTLRNMSEFMLRYTDQAWIYACIRVIQTKGCGVDLKVYRAGKDGDAEELPDHPLKTLLDHPNPWMSGVDLRESMHGYIELTGSHYWLLDKVIGQKPTEIYPLRPDRIVIIPDAEKFIKAYEYRINGQLIDSFQPEEIVHFRYWHPLDDYYGHAPISAARDAADSLMYSDRYNRKFFENSAQPGGILSSTTRIGEESRKRILQSWKDMHGGVSRAHRIAVLEGGLTWQATAATHQDMQFTELKRMTREDILAMYQIPPIMVGVFDEANYSNAREQRRIFWIDCMIPRLKKAEDVLNHFLAPRFGKDVFVAYDLSGVEALKEDQKLLAETDAILTRWGIKTINEARADRNLDPVDWGDTWNAPSALLPIEEHTAASGGGEPGGGSSSGGGSGGGSGGMGSDNPDAENEVGKSFADLLKEHQEKVAQFYRMKSEEPVAVAQPAVVEAKDDPAAIAKEIRTKKWGLFKDATEKWERDWHEPIRKLFHMQREEVLANLEGENWPSRATQIRLSGFNRFKADISVILFDHSVARKEFRKTGRGLMEKTLSQSAQDQLRQNDLPPEFNVQEPQVQTWLDKKAFKFADEVNATTEDALRETLKEGIAAGESIDKISARVADVFDIAEGSRTEMIARTETISAANAGAYMAYGKTGMVGRTEWITARDEKVRDSHQIDGEESPYGTPFSNGLLYPGDPAGAAEDVINCRCASSPIVDRGEE